MVARVPDIRIFPVEVLTRTSWKPFVELEHVAGAVRQQSDGPSPFYGQRKTSLMFGAVARYSARYDLSTIGGEIFQGSYVFIIDFQAGVRTKLTHLPPMEDAFSFSRKGHDRMPPYSSSSDEASSASSSSERRTPSSSSSSSPSSSFSGEGSGGAPLFFSDVSRA